MPTDVIVDCATGEVVETPASEEEVTPVPEPIQTAVTVTVDPQALSDAQNAIASATTVAGLRAAVLGALALLNPGE